ncbi:GtrA family protein [Sphingomonas arenae]|uniref:GtrA family protein n=1 Tax=Sphingomonas arenae TaxID=2812555 RepID=UPI001967F3BE
MAEPQSRGNSEPQPRLSRIAELLRFGASSAASALLSLGLPVLFHEGIGLSVQLSVGMSQLLMLAANYLMLRTFVFRSRGRVRGEAASYLASAATFRGLEYLAFTALYQLARLPYFPALVAVLLVSTIAKYAWYRWVFGRAAR